MAMCVWMKNVWCLWLVCAFASNVRASVDGSGGGGGSSSAQSFTCNQVGEFFQGDFGAPTALHGQPEPESDTSLCRLGKGRRGGSGGDGGGGDDHPHTATCCSKDAELKFAEVAGKRLKENLRTRNHALKKHLTNILARYQDRITQLVAEAQNRTSVFLTRLHKVPWSAHEAVVKQFFAALLRVVKGGVTPADSLLEETVREFFTGLFPPVFSYVLTVQGQEERKEMNSEYNACLKRYAEQIQPFGNQPDVILKHLRHTVRHATVFQEALRVFVDSVSASETVAMTTSCRHALLRLQVCPGCRGLGLKNLPLKPCRGMCLNVMRGCLAKTSEISSSWDDLVVAFENTQVGLMGRHDIQKSLLYMDMNVSEAVMMAMSDSRRIYDEVKVKCRHLAQNDDNQHPHNSSSHHHNNNDNNNNNDDDAPHPHPHPQPHSLPVPLIPGDASEVIPSRNVQRVLSFRQELRSLVKYLEDSKGLFNRLPDGLCQEATRFDQDMQSAACWNGSSVGRYMEQVPEANFLSQVQHNPEVNITLLDPDLDLLMVKESLTHMRRNLSSLLNAEVMLRDGPVYKNVGGGGGGGEGGAVVVEEEGGREGSGFHQPVIVDDEDLVAYGSASGSGSGGGRDGEDEVPDNNTEDPRGVQPDTPRYTPKPPSSSHRITTSVAVLLLCVMCQRLLSLLQ